MNKKIILNNKIMVSELKSIALFMLLSVLAYILILISLWFDGWCQNLFLGLGTGAATSALVSMVFYFNDKQIKIREHIKQRTLFMHEFKILYRNIVYSIDFAYGENAILDFDSYVEKQHRWYHDYYKRIVANNFTEKETMDRKERMVDFILLNLPLIQQTFEYGLEWRKGDYSLWQETELLSFYAGFKTMQIYINQNDYKAAFLEFSCFLEVIKRISSEFTELSNFKLLRFKYDDNGKMNIDGFAFEEREPILKFAREFQYIRNDKYVKQYSKESAESKMVDTRDE